MAFISVTRLRVRSRHLIPFFGFRAFMISRQAQKAPGFRGGYLGFSPGFAFWTVTVWQDESDMRAFRNAGAHVRAMPKLIRWCDEASYAHWQSEKAEVPEPAFAAEKLSTVGRLSKVRKPSFAHSEGKVWPDAQVPSIARDLSL